VVPSEFETVVYNAIGGLKEVLVDINGELSSNPADFVAIAIDEEAFFSDALTTVTNVT
ncbi:MAG: hypothetical protein GY804_04675, partial [Alphaproteobacteria bacterium]|nr:hypothetical protein [Alphaproteobacteria bacterium]